MSDGNDKTEIRRWIESHSEVIPNILQYRTNSQIDKRLEFLEKKKSQIPLPERIVNPRFDEKKEAVLRVTVAKTLSTQQKRWLNEYKLLSLCKKYKEVKRQQSTNFILQAQASLLISVGAAGMYKELTQIEKKEYNDDLVESLLLLDVLS